MPIRMIEKKRQIIRSVSKEKRKQNLCILLVVNRNSIIGEYREN